MRARRSSPRLRAMSPAASPVFDGLDYFWLAFFSGELVVKALAQGLVAQHDAYLRDPWNAFDATSLAVMYAGLGTGGGSILGRVMRVGRVLRPLRLIRRNDAMRVIVNAVLAAMPEIFHVCVIIALYLFIFGVIGMMMFGGLFYACNDPSVRDVGECVGVYESLTGNLVIPRVWANPPYSFDSIGEAVLILLEIFSLRGWVPVLNSATDATAVGLQARAAARGPRAHVQHHARAITRAGGRAGVQPRALERPENALFFVAYHFIGAFFLMRVFVGVIVARFRQVRCAPGACGRLFD